MSQLVYILQLQNNKWYIGRTKNLQVRIQQHMDGKASIWTKLHPCITVVQTFLGNGFDEDKTTLEYMEKYDVENVRGGVYSNINLTFQQMLSIRRHIYGARDLCIACGYNSHFISNCFAIICYRCGRPGHYAESCQETTHFYNGKLDGCSRCGRSDHWKWRCNRSKDIFGRVLRVPTGIIQVFKKISQKLF